AFSLEPVVVGWRFINEKAREQGTAVEREGLGELAPIDRVLEARYIGRDARPFESQFLRPPARQHVLAHGGANEVERAVERSPCAGFVQLRPEETEQLVSSVVSARSCDGQINDESQPFRLGQNRLQGPVVVA